MTTQPECVTTSETNTSDKSIIPDILVSFNLNLKGMFMMNIIEELYFGNIDPNTESIDSESDFGKASMIVSQNEDKLMELLEGKEKEIFIALLNAQSEIDAITAVKKSTKGFQLGAKFTLDALVSPQENMLIDIT